MKMVLFAKKAIFLLMAALTALFAREVSAAAPTYGPDTVTAKAVSASEIDVSWSSVTAGPAVTGYAIERESPIGGGFTTIVANTGSSGTSYNDTGLSPGVVYNYRISAVNGDGTGPASSRMGADVTFSSPIASIAPPSKPTNLSAVAVSGYVVALSWTAPRDSLGIIGYKIEKDTGGGFGVVSANTGSSGTNYTDASLVPGITYVYRVSAVNAYGASAPSAPVFVTMPVPPGVPRNVMASAGDGEVAVSWLAPYFQVGGVTGYKVSIVGAASSSMNVSRATTNTTVTGLTNGISYSFGVTASNAAGDGPAATTNTVIPSAAQASGHPVTSQISQSAAPSPTSTTAAFYFYFGLWRGSKGEAVTALQNVLVARGFYSGPITGYFGPLTEAAVKVYQSAHYVSPVGIVGPLTRAYLNAGF